MNLEEIQNRTFYMYAMLIYYVQLWWYWIMSIISRKEIVTFDNGKSVRITKQIAEGGFSVVFEALELRSNPAAKNKNKSNPNSYHNTKYALKRVLCGDSESIQKCREEAAVHSSFHHHSNLVPLLGIKFETHGDFEFCYLLFPYLSASLRDDINVRNLLLQDELGEGKIKAVKPYKERELLEIFSGCVDAVVAFHEKNLAHRDIKVENVMFHPNTGAPILIDYGSVGPLELQVRTRSDVLNITDKSSLNSTISYRAPELFDGTPYGNDEPAIDGRTDVWSLGCLLFAMMYGSSPFECEFKKDGSTVKIVECSQLRVLGQTPRPISNSMLDNRYNMHFPELFDFVEYMLTQDRLLRPNIDQVVAKLDVLLKKVGGTWCWRQGAEEKELDEDDEDDAFVQFV